MNDKMPSDDEGQSVKGGTGKPLGASGRQSAKEDFGRRLVHLMETRGLSSSDLARRAGVTRDAVSKYTRGINYPTDASLTKLASALRLTVEDLAPGHTEATLGGDEHAVDLKVSRSDPATAWLRVNRKVSTSVAMQIIELLNQDEASNGRGSS